MFCRNLSPSFQSPICFYMVRPTVTNFFRHITIDCTTIMVVCTRPVYDWCIRVCVCAISLNFVEKYCKQYLMGVFLRGISELRTLSKMSGLLFVWRRRLYGNSYSDQVFSIVAKCTQKSSRILNILYQSQCIAMSNNSMRAVLLRELTQLHSIHA